MLYNSHIVVGWYIQNMTELPALNKENSPSDLKNIYFLKIFNFFSMQENCIIFLYIMHFVGLSYIKYAFLQISYKSYAN